MGTQTDIAQAILAMEAVIMRLLAEEELARRCTPMSSSCSPIRQKKKTM